VTGSIAAGCALLGLLVGSFLNVVIWRVPRKESVVTPGSHCPGCGAAIAPRDNVPLLSWIFLRYTGTSIARVFFITAGTFAGMSLYGYTTRKDLTAMGGFLFMGLIGLVAMKLRTITA